MGYMGVGSIAQYYLKSAWFAHVILNVSNHDGRLVLRI